ncbi:MAG TPA: membrane protein insertion efficiency factor YidD [Candidatus Acidoferrales bacterium]|nr:membrane protein insertion efficiency factor YidD [Candidatus Acidoferrales bacterium]
MAMPLRILNRLQRSPRMLALGALAVYRAALSPIIHALNHNRPACRFEPSCSEYARDAIAEHGLARGVAMALWRVARCNPWGGHGYDPVASAQSGQARN